MSLDGRYVVRPLRRALLLLDELIAEGRPMPLSELAERTALPKATTFRYLYTLAAAGFVIRLGGQLYLPSPRIVPHPPTTSLVGRLKATARPAMQRLQRRFNETVNLGIRDGGDVVYVDMIGSTRSLRMEARIGTRDPLHATALGKAMLATLPATDRLAGLPARLAAATPNTLTGRRAFAAELARTAARGWALDLEENELGACCVAAGFSIADGALLAGISISGPKQRVGEEAMARMGAALARAVAPLRDGG